jgi:regulatory protein
MMERKITALRVQKRNQQRVNVYLDGDFAFGLARIVAAWLQVGQALNSEKIAELQSQDEKEIAYQRALRFIQYRPRTQSELRQNLRKHEVSEPVIEYVLDRLQQTGLTNDRRFAENWIENRSDLRPRSRFALAHELKKRGVASEIIETSLNEVDDSELAYQAACKQYRKYSNFDWQIYRQKMYGFLGRRGFNYEASSAAATRVWEENHGSTPDSDLPDEPYTNHFESEDEEVNS